MARRPRLLMIVLPALATLALGSAVVSIARSNASSPAEAPRSTPPSAADFRSGPGVLGALGTVEPAGREIAVAARLSGVVAEVRVEAGQRVQAGDVLFSIDTAVAAATLAERRRDLALAEARAMETRQRAPVAAADAAAARNALDAARADLDEARDLVRIAEQLRSGTAITEREMTRRRNQLRAAQSRYAEAEARLARADAEWSLLDPARGGASVRIAAATVAQAEAAVALAATDLEQRIIRAPADGTVLAVNVRPGEYATSGAATAPVVMGRLDPLHVRVEIDEADIPRYANGSPAVALPRGRPDERIALRYVRAEPLVVPKRNLSGAGTDRVDTRVLQIVYEVEGDAKGLLRTGQVVDVFILPPGAQLLSSRR